MTLEAKLRGIVGSAQVLQGGDLSAYEIGRASCRERV